MSVTYRGITPERNYSLKDFYENRIVIAWLSKFKNGDGTPQLRVVFRSNGYLGEIRTTCYGTSYAVDVRWEWGTDRCLTTECKSIREAKSILFQWFKEKGFYRKSFSGWRERDLAYQNVQLTLSPFIFKQ